MQFVWKATFIDEFVPKPIALRRSQSEPSMGPSSGSSLFAGEREYVATLETKACQLKSPESLKKFSHRRTTSVASAASISSTQCPPTPRRQVSNDTDSDCAPSKQVSDEPTTPGAFTSSSSDVSFGEESPAAPVAPAPSTPACGCNPGSVGHPGLCKRPCIQFARGDCAAGAECQFCHLAHSGRSPHLDKRHRELLKNLPFGKKVAVVLPIIRRQIARLGITAEAQELLAGLESVACSDVSDARRPPSATTSLQSSLGALSLRSLMTAICKAADTPDWLQPDALEEQLERIRSVEKAHTRRYQ